MNQKDRFGILERTITYETGRGTTAKTLRPALQMGLVTTTIVGGDFEGALQSIEKLNPDMTGVILFCCGCGVVDCGSSLIVATEKSNQNFLEVKYRTVGCEMPVYLAKSVSKKDYAKAIKKLQKILKKIVRKEPYECPIPSSYVERLKAFKREINKPNTTVGDWNTKVI